MNETDRAAAPSGVLLAFAVHGQLERAIVSVHWLILCVQLLMLAWILVSIPLPIWAGIDAPCAIRAGVLVAALWIVPPCTVRALREARRHRALLALGPGARPGLRVERGQAQRLFAVVERVSSRIGVPAPGALLLHGGHFLNAGVELDRPGGPGLHLGLALLEQLDVDELEVVLAHELAHLAHRSPASRLVDRTYAQWAKFLLSRLETHDGPTFVADEVAVFAWSYVERIGHHYWAWRRAKELVADRIAAAVTSRERVVAVLSRLETLGTEAHGLDGGDEAADDRTHPTFGERARALGLDPSRLPMLPALGGGRASQLVDKLERLRELVGATDAACEGRLRKAAGG